MKHYYHAGSQSSDDMTGQARVLWSDKTRRTARMAERESRKLAKNHGGTPVVEYWPAEHGLRPGWDCASGSYEVQP